MTNAERADELDGQSRDVAGEMRAALGRGRWNLATRRAQEVVELTIKALLTRMTIDYPRTHDPAPLLLQTISERGLVADAARLPTLAAISARLADLRAPAFYVEIAVSEDAARDHVAGAERWLTFAEELRGRLQRR